VRVAPGGVDAAQPMARAAGAAGSALAATEIARFALQVGR
jgi:hypothetical protein